MTIAFTPRFYDPKPFIHKPPRPTPKTPKPIVLSQPEHRHVLASPDYSSTPAFKNCVSEYWQILDRVVDFSNSNSKKISPPLPDRSVKAINKHFDELREHIHNPRYDYFEAHKEVIFGSGKEMFHELDNLLQDEKIPLQKRMNAVTMMAPSMGMCSGGVLTALQEAVSSLKNSTAGIRGAAFRAKIQMMDSLISQFVQNHHRGYGIGNEVHYVNAYFNDIAPYMGVPPRTDRFTSIAKPNISLDQRDSCRKLVLAKLNPSALTKIMAESYLDQIKGAQQVDVNRPVEGDDLNDVFRRSNDIKQATLTNEFGEVPDSSYLIPVSDTYLYQFARQSTLIAKHFMETLKEEKLVNYDDALTLTQDEKNGEIRMLGDLFWRDRGGDCEELEARELLASSPLQMSQTLRHAKVSPSARGEVFSGIAQHLLDSREVEHVDSVPDAWLGEFSALLDEGSISKAQMGPVVELAAHFGCPDTLRALIRRHVEVDNPGAHGYTPLMLAAQNGQASAVTLLLQARANPWMTTARGETALILGARGGHTQAVQALIPRSAVGGNVQNPNLASALMVAASEGHTDTLIALIHAGANLTLVDIQGRSAVQLARLKGHASAAQVLEAAVNAPPGEDKTLLMAYAEHGRSAALQGLVHQGGIDVNAQNSSGTTALMKAARGGHVEAMRALLEAGADPGIEDHEGRSALAHARLAGHRSAAQELAGRELTPRPQAGDTVLMMSAQRGHIEAIDILIEQGELNINARNPSAMTALMMAAQGGHGHVLRALIQAGADPNMQSHDGMTALHWLVAKNPSGATETDLLARREALVTLIQAQADLTVRNKQGQTAATIAKTSGDSCAFELLEAAARTANGDTLLMTCAAQGYRQALAALLQQPGIDINARNPKGMTATMFAAASGRLETLIPLIDARPDLTLKDSRGRNALMVAESTRWGSSTEAAILAAAAVAPQRRGTTLMECAARGHVRAVRALLQHSKQDINARDSNGRTALMLAAQSGHAEVLRALRHAQADPTIRDFRGFDAGHYESVLSIVQRQIGKPWTLPW